MLKTPVPVIDEAVDIARPIDDVWRVLTDWGRAGEWLPNVSECAPSPTEEGATLPFRYQGQPAVTVIEQVRAPEHLVIRRPNGPIDAWFTYDLSTTTGGTTVRLKADLRTKKGIGLMASLLRRFLARTDRDQLRRLKAVVEGTDPPIS